MKIKSGEYEVFHSGTVISYEDEPIAFEIDENLIIKMIFSEEVSLSEPKMDFKTIGNNQIDIMLINFSSALGIGNIRPLKLGFINGRYLYLNFKIISSDNVKSKTIFYTWYLRETR